MVGEGILEMLMASTCNLGGNSKHFGVSLGMGFEKLTMSVQGLGFPGSSSHPNGTDAEVWRGGVSIPGLSGECIGGGLNSGSLGILLSASQLSIVAPLFLSLPLCFWLCF